jgi:hypothetical protein
MGLHVRIYKQSVTGRTGTSGNAFELVPGSSLIRDTDFVVFLSFSSELHHYRFVPRDSQFIIQQSFYSAT